jgi:hypothetical protein
LSKLWLAHSSAFGRKQRRLYADLIKWIEKLWDLLNNLAFTTQLNIEDDISYLGWNDKTISSIVNRAHHLVLKDLDPLLDSLTATFQDYEAFNLILRRISANEFSTEQLQGQMFFSWYHVALRTLLEEDLPIVQKMIDKVIATHAGSKQLSSQPSSKDIQA